MAALGHYRAEWFLRFMGLEAFPVYREGGRLQNYVGKVSWQSHQFQACQMALKAAAESLERFDRRLGGNYRSLSGRALVLLTLSRFTLQELTEETAPDRLLQRLRLLKDQVIQKN